MNVGLFVTCLVDALRPRIGFATVELLEAAGCVVEVPASQTCCGQPGFNSGDRASGTELAMAFLRDFEHFDAVVAPSGSCISMIRDYPGLFAGQPEVAGRLAALAARSHELSDFLLNHAPQRLPAGKLQLRVCYHDSCSGLRTLGVKQQPRELIGAVQGVELSEMREAEVCCGFGGAFSVKLGVIATRMADNKCVNAAATGADAVVGGDLGCLVNIEGRLRRRGDHQTRVLHFAELLAEGLDSGHHD
ncbi:MAG: (Fe-S)-binding protein [Pseudomonadota bacterium]|nr:(Fe-S)-binding protein [Pseudomonadota bacterium]